MITSGIINAVLYYLTIPGSGADGLDRRERAGRFLNVLGRNCVIVPNDGGLGAALHQAQQGASQNNYLQLLVQKLQAALAQEVCHAASRGPPPPPPPPYFSPP